MLTAASVMISGWSWSWDIHDEAMADAARSPEAGIATDYRRHQLVGVETALHQRFGAALSHQLDRLGRGLAVSGIDDFEATNIEAMLCRDLADPAVQPADKDRLHQLQLGRLTALSATTGRRMSDGDLDRRMFLRPGDQRMQPWSLVLILGGASMTVMTGSPLPVDYRVRIE